MYQLHRNGSPEATEELLSLALGPNFTIITYSACIVNGVRFVVENRDMKHKTQNSGISVPGTDNMVFYGVLEDIIELTYLNNYTVTLFKCKWYDTDPKKKKLLIDNNITSISVNTQWYKDDPYILATQAQQVFYIDDLLNGPNWRVVHTVVHRNIWDIAEDGITVPDLTFLQENNSSNFNLTVDLGDFHLVNWRNEGNDPTIVQESRDVRAAAEGVDALVDDDDNFEDETIEDYIEDEPLQSDDIDETNNRQHMSASFTDSESD